MKKILTKALALSSICLLMLSACKKNGVLVTSNGGIPGTLSASATTVPLDKTRLADTTKIINFTFTQPNFGFSAAVTNTLQIDAASDNFKTPVSATLGTKVLSQGYSTNDFNALLLKLNLTAGVASQVQVRVMHSISATVAPVYSNVVTLTVTPYNLASWLYLVGQFNNYSTSTADSLYSPTGNGIYTGIINVTAGNNQFLILPVRNFNNKYATTTSPSGTATSITYATEYVSSGGNNLYTPAAPGCYFISLNTNTNTITVALANTYSCVGTTTPGANFAGDEPFTKYVNDGVTGWTGTFNFTYGTFPGSFKVRQNDDFTWSWGVPNSGSAGFGIANTLNDTSNSNIPVATSGTYTVTFYEPPSAQGASIAASTPPSVTATYTIH